MTITQITRRMRLLVRTMGLPLPEVTMAGEYAEDQSGEGGTVPACKLLLPGISHVRSLYTGYSRGRLTDIAGSNGLHHGAKPHKAEEHAIGETQPATPGIFTQNVYTPEVETRRHR